MRPIHDSQVLGDQTADNGSIEHGTVGWEDGGKHFDRRSGGPPLVKVTLFRGRVPGEDGSKTGSKRAHGRKVLCVVGSPLTMIPPDGARVIIAYPADSGFADGMGVIISMVVPEPTQFNENAVKMDFGPDTDVFIKARSVTIGDYENRYVTVGPETGIKCGDADASGFCLINGSWQFYGCDSGDVKAMVEFSAFAGIRCVFSDSNGPQGMTIGGGNVIVFGVSFTSQCAACYLHPSATAATPVFIGPGPSAATAVFGF